MKVKRYIGHTVQETMQKVKNEMGKDALILSTRKIRQKGIMGWFKKSLVEVVAAADEAGDGSLAPRRIVPLNAMSYASAVRPDDTSKVLEKLEAQIASMGETLNRLTSSFRVEEDGAGLGIKREYVPYYEILVKNEVNEDIAKGIIQKAGLLHEGSSADFERCLEQVLMEHIGHPQPLEVSPGKRKVVVFVGPTGVGKTTSLAKLAAIFSIQKQMKVGLITADTYRIAAVDQLKIYAEIMEIPLSILYSPREVVAALEEHRDNDVVFVDTAGKSIKDRAQEKEILELISLSKADEVYLALSCNTSYSGCLNIINSYSFLPDYKLLFTKMDEASSYGLILNCRYISGKPLSYIATGQNVPDDIEVADPYKLLSSIMKRVED